MDAERSIAILNRQREAITALEGMTSSAPAFTKWHRDTQVAVERIFGEQSRHVQDFVDVRYHLMVWTTSTTDFEHQAAFRRGLQKADAVLQSFIDEIREYDIPGAVEVGVPDQLSLIERICLHFHRVYRQLQARHGGRPTIVIQDEYDVQDLLHALLRLHFDDVRPEEWTPSFAGASARVDFLLKEERIVVEVKKTRPSMNVGELGAQLLVDIARYERHPDCGTLVCFIYDADGRIGNPVGLERDLEAHSGTLRVRVIVGPKT